MLHANCWIVALPATGPTDLRAPWALGLGIDAEELGLLIGGRVLHLVVGDHLRAARRGALAAAAAGEGSLSGRT